MTEIGTRFHSKPKYRPLMMAVCSLSEGSDEEKAPTADHLPHLFGTRIGSSPFPLLDPREELD